MKITLKQTVSLLAFTVVLGMGGNSVQAAGKAGAGSNNASANVTAPAPGPEATSKEEKAASVEDVLVSIKAPTTPASTEEDLRKGSTTDAKKKDSEKKKSSAEDEFNLPDKIPSSVEGIVKKLHKDTKDVTLDDLNEAREAIVKLDVLIDIEKRLSDLEKIRNDRSGAKEKALSAALPMSALSKKIPPIDDIELKPKKVVEAPVKIAPPPPPPQAEVEVLRVLGASGVYSAQITENKGESKRVRVGDKLNDGSVVTAISRSGVTLKAFDNKTRTIQVKDVNMVFSGR